MKKLIVSTMIIMMVISIVGFNRTIEKLVSQKTHISFFSSTPVEDITANNYKASSTLDTSNGDMIFSVPMQSFEFEKALMQKHYNGEDFLDTKKYPRSKFVGKITNLESIDFKKNGTYSVIVEGDMTIKDKTNPIKEQGKLTVIDGVITAESTFKITLADYGVVFEKGKPASNIAKTIEIRFEGEYGVE
jgi:polyisoprenoid-binding protein YceI